MDTSIPRMNGRDAGDAKVSELHCTKGNATQAKDAGGSAGDCRAACLLLLPSIVTSSLHSPLPHCAPPRFSHLHLAPPAPSLRRARRLCSATHFPSLLTSSRSASLLLNRLFSSPPSFLVAAAVHPPPPPPPMTTSSSSPLLSPPLLPAPPPSPSSPPYIRPVLSLCPQSAKKGSRRLEDTGVEGNRPSLAMASNEGSRGGEMEAMAVDELRGGGAASFTSTSLPCLCLRAAVSPTIVALQVDDGRKRRKSVVEGEMR